MSTLLEQIWYKNNPLYFFLVPFSCIYQIIAVLRRYLLSWIFEKQFPVPVIVVGNITVGGVGKTPLVIELAKKLTKRGLSVGIVSRGYGATVQSFPYLVNVDSTATQVGDEPLLMAKRTGCPVVIAPKRVQAVDYLLSHYDCDVVISDDGLQHYAMARAIEIAVIDGIRQFGNGWCLPAGPLREPPKRIKHCDFVVINGEKQDVNTDCSLNTKKYSMQLQPGSIVNLVDGQQHSIDSFNAPIAAVAAIGHPQRFFALLRSMGLSVQEYPFRDHYCFRATDLDVTEKVVIMTEKDAVKCQKFARKNWFFLPVEATLADEFWQSLYSHPQLERLLHR